MTDVLLPLPRISDWLPEDEVAIPEEWADAMDALRSGDLPAVKACLQENTQTLPSLWLPGQCKTLLGWLIEQGPVGKTWAQTLVAHMDTAWDLDELGQGGLLDGLLIHGDLTTFKWLLRKLPATLFPDQQLRSTTTLLRSASAEVWDHYVQHPRACKDVLSVYDLDLVAPQERWTPALLLRFLREAPWVAQWSGKDVWGLCCDAAESWPEQGRSDALSQAVQVLRQRHASEPSITTFWKGAADAAIERMCQPGLAALVAPRAQALDVRQEPMAVHLVGVLQRRAAMPLLPLLIEAGMPWGTQACHAMLHSFQAFHKLFQAADFYWSLSQSSPAAQRAQLVDLADNARALMAVGAPTHFYHAGVSVLQDFLRLAHKVVPTPANPVQDLNELPREMVALLHDPAFVPDHHWHDPWPDAPSFAALRAVGPTPHEWALNHPSSCWQAIGAQRLAHNMGEAMDQTATATVAPRRRM